MTRDDIIRMARQAGMKACCGRTDKSGKHHPTVNALFSTVPIQWLEQFATLAVEQAVSKEREACAKLCEAIEADRWGAYKGHVPHEQRPENGSEYVQGQSCGADMCMDAIRAMGAR